MRLLTDYPDVYDAYRQRVFEIYYKPTGREEFHARREKTRDARISRIKRRLNARK